MSKTPRLTFGNPLLAPSGAQTFDLLEFKRHKLQVRVIAELDTHGLFYTRKVPLAYPHLGKMRQATSVIATHPNGHSCKELADRILAVWSGKETVQRAVEQLEYISRCGGLTSSIDGLRSILSPEVSNLRDRKGWEYYSEKPFAEDLKKIQFMLRSICYETLEYAGSVWIRRVD